MRTLMLSMLLIPLAGVVFGNDKQTTKKKGVFAELEGTWKNDAMVVNGRQFQAIMLTIQPDGKVKSTYKEKKGAEFTPSVAEVRIILAMVEGQKELVRAIENYLGVQWIVRRHSPTEIIATAIYPTDGRLIAVEFSFKKVPEKKE